VITQMQELVRRVNEALDEPWNKSRRPVHLRRPCRLHPRRHPARRRSCRWFGSAAPGCRRRRLARWGLAAPWPRAPPRCL